MEEVVVGTYHGEGYSLTLASNWYLDERELNRTFFYGPKVGDARVGFYVTVVDKNGKTYWDAAKRSKEDQKTEEQYTVLEEKDISQDQFKAFMRRSAWYAPTIDMMLFVREIFTESEDKVYIISASIPNGPDLEELDKVTVAMMNSFQFES